MDSIVKTRDRRVLGNALRAIRRRAGTTQRELFLGEGLDETYISRVENGRLDVKWTSLRRILRSLGADLNDLADEVSRIEKQGTSTAHRADGYPPEA